MIVFFIQDLIQVFEEQWSRGRVGGALFMDLMMEVSKLTYFEAIFEQKVVYTILSNIFYMWCYCHE